MQAVKALYKEGNIEFRANSKEEFMALGLGSFFDTDEDNNVDWEAMFVGATLLEKTQEYFHRETVLL
uniref:Uncharacterized protein n=1 Tax=Chlorobium chlorochromatii (strain CaD3) TaxID=340177 RepID=Q3ASU1_CHLCH